MNVNNPEDMMGRVVRYSEGETALFKVETYNTITHGEKRSYRYYGTHVLGGAHGANDSDIVEASAEDLETWKQHQGDYPQETKKALDINKAIRPAIAFADNDEAYRFPETAEQHIRGLVAIIKELNTKANPVSRELLEEIIGELERGFSGADEEPELICKSVHERLVSALQTAPERDLQ